MALRKKKQAYPLIGGLRQDLSADVMPPVNYVEADNVTYKKQGESRSRKALVYAGDLLNSQKLLTYNEQLFGINIDGVSVYSSVEKTFNYKSSIKSLNLDFFFISQKEEDILHPSIYILGNDVHIIYVNNNRVLYKAYNIKENNFIVPEREIHVNLDEVLGTDLFFIENKLRFAYSTKDEVVMRSIDDPSETSSFDWTGDDFKYDNGYIYTKKGSVYGRRRIKTDLSFEDSVVADPITIGYSGSPSLNNGINLHQFNTWTEFDLGGERYKTVWSAGAGVFIVGSQDSIVSKFNSGFVPLEDTDRMKLINDPKVFDDSIIFPILFSGQIEVEGTLSTRPLGLALVQVSDTEVPYFNQIINNQMILTGSSVNYYDGENFVELGFSQRPNVEVISNPNIVEFERTEELRRGIITRTSTAEDSVLVNFEQIIKGSSYSANSVTVTNADFTGGRGANGTVGSIAGDGKTLEDDSVLSKAYYDTTNERIVLEFTGVPSGVIAGGLKIGDDFLFPDYESISGTTLTAHYYRASNDFTESTTDLQVVLRDTYESSDLNLDIETDIKASKAFYQEIFDIIGTPPVDVNIGDGILRPNYLVDSNSFEHEYLRDQASVSDTTTNYQDIAATKDFTFTAALGDELNNFLFLNFVGYPQADTTPDQVSDATGSEYSGFTARDEEGDRYTWDQNGYSLIGTLNLSVDGITGPISIGEAAPWGSYVYNDDGNRDTGSAHVNRLRINDDDSFSSPFFSLEDFELDFNESGDDLYLDIEDELNNDLPLYLEMKFENTNHKIIWRLPSRIYDIDSGTDVRFIRNDDIDPVFNNVDENDYGAAAQFRLRLLTGFSETTTDTPKRNGIDLSDNSIVIQKTSVAQSVADNNKLLAIKKSGVIQSIFIAEGADGVVTYRPFSNVQSVFNSQFTGLNLTDLKNNADDYTFDVYPAQTGITITSLGSDNPTFIAAFFDTTTTTSMTDIGNFVSSSVALEHDLKRFYLKYAPDTGFSLNLIFEADSNSALDVGEFVDHLLLVDKIIVRNVNTNAEYLINDFNDLIMGSLTRDQLVASVMGKTDPEISLTVSDAIRRISLVENKADFRVILIDNKSIDSNFERASGNYNVELTSSNALTAQSVSNLLELNVGDNNVLLGLSRFQKFDTDKYLYSTKRSVDFVYPFKSESTITFVYDSRKGVSEEVLEKDVVTLDEQIEIRTYGYRTVYKWLDAYGFEHRSETSLPVTLQTSQDIDVDNPIGVKVNMLNLTSKNSVLIEIYRTSKNTLTYRKVADLVNDPRLESINYSDVKEDTELEEVLPADNFQPDGCKIIESYQDRFVLAGFINYPNRILISNPINFSGNFGVTFNLDNSLLAEEEVVAIKSLDQVLIIFCTNKIFSWAFGDASLNEITAANNITAIDQKSIAVTNKGIVFQSNQGVHLLTRSAEVLYLGDPIQNYNEERVISAAESRIDQEIRLATENRILVYNYHYDKWSTHDVRPRSMVVFKDDFYYLMNDGRMLRESRGIGDFPIDLQIETGWLNLADIEGYQKLKGFILLGKFVGLENISAEIFYDFQPKSSQILENKEFDTPSNPSAYGVGTFEGTGDSHLREFRFLPRRQKCSSIKIRFNIRSRETELSSLSFEFYQFKGLARVIPQQTLNN